MNSRVLKIPAHLLLVYVSISSSAQQAEGVKPRPPELSLTLTADPLDARGVPREIYLTIENVSDHSLRMPAPHFGCGLALSGYLTISTGYSRVLDEQHGSSSASTSSCIGDSASAGPSSATEVIKDWKTLEPGGKLELKENVVKLVDAKMKGNYSITVNYLPPQLPEDYRKALQEAGIAYPLQNVSSKSLSFTLDQD